MLEGMFAFALYDVALNTITLVRDPSGIKPLYYHFGNQRLIFASELKAFYPLPITWQNDENWQVLFMAYGHIPEPHTTKKEIKLLPKGSLLTYHITNTQLETETYFTYSFDSVSTSFSNPESWLRTSIEKAVESQLIADVPVGVFLSGGIDSSILSLVADRSIRSELHTISICFEEENYSERKYQDLVLEKIKGYKHRLLLTRQMFSEHLSTVFDDMDMPSCDGINTWFISKFTREQGIKGVLSGIGADELFGGYPSFRRMGKINLLRKMPKELRSKLSRLSSKKFKRLTYLELDGIEGDYLFLRGHFSIREIAENIDVSEKEIKYILQEASIFSPPDSLKGNLKASWMEFNLYMQNQLLRDADVMSMAHGVEIRVPFLDHNLIKGVLSMPENDRFKKGYPKQFLIDAHLDLLPEEVWKRKKMGFSLPFNEWLKKNLWVEDIMQSSDKKLSIAYKNFLEGNIQWYHLIALLVMKRRCNEI
jgi:asparagine synthase (glutamine-hydrolysing)